MNLLLLLASILSAFAVLPALGTQAHTNSVRQQDRRAIESQLSASASRPPLAVTMLSSLVAHNTSNASTPVYVSSNRTLSVTFEANGEEGVTRPTFRFRFNYLEATDCIFSEWTVAGSCLAPQSSSASTGDDYIEYSSGKWCRASPQLPSGRVRQIRYVIQPRDENGFGADCERHDSVTIKNALYTSVNSVIGDLVVERMQPCGVPLCPTDCALTETDLVPCNHDSTSCIEGVKLVGTFVAAMPSLLACSNSTSLTCLLEAGDSGVAQLPGATCPPAGTLNNYSLSRNLSDFLLFLEDNVRSPQRVFDSWTPNVTAAELTDLVGVRFAVCPVSPSCQGNHTTTTIPTTATLTTTMSLTTVLLTQIKTTTTATTTTISTFSSVSTTSTTTTPRQPSVPPSALDYQVLMSQSPRNGYLRNHVVYDGWLVKGNWLARSQWTVNSSLTQSHHWSATLFSAAYVPHSSDWLPCNQTDRIVRVTSTGIVQQISQCVIVIPSVADGLHRLELVVYNGSVAQTDTGTSSTLVRSTNLFIVVDTHPPQMKSVSLFIPTSPSDSRSQSCSMGEICPTLILNTVSPSFLITLTDPTTASCNDTTATRSLCFPSPLITTSKGLGCQACQPMLETAVVAECRLDRAANYTMCSQTSDGVASDHTASSSMLQYILAAPVVRDSESVSLVARVLTAADSDPHTVQVRVVDAIGNSAYSTNANIDRYGIPPVLKWVSDLTQPIPFLASWPSARHVNTPALLFGLSCSEPNVSFVIFLDSKLLPSCSDLNTQTTPYFAQELGSATGSQVVCEAISHVSLLAQDEKDGLDSQTLLHGLPRFIRLSNLMEGEHVISVAAVDAAGNLGSRRASFSFAYDTSPPTVALASIPTGATAERGKVSTAVEWKASIIVDERVKALYCRLSAIPITGVASCCSTQPFRRQLTSTVDPTLCEAYCATSPVANTDGRTDAVISDMQNRCFAGNQTKETLARREYSKCLQRLIIDTLPLYSTYNASLAVNLTATPYGLVRDDGVDPSIDSDWFLCQRTLALKNLQEKYVYTLELAAQDYAGNDGRSATPQRITRYSWAVDPLYLQHVSSLKLLRQQQLSQMSAFSAQTEVSCQPSSTLILVCVLGWLLLAGVAGMTLVVKYMYERERAGNQSQLAVNVSEADIQALERMLGDELNFEADSAGFGSPGFSDITLS